MLFDVELEEKVFNRVRDLIDSTMTSYNTTCEGDDAMVEALAQRISVGALLYSFLQTDKETGNKMGAFIDSKIGEWSNFLLENGFLSSREVTTEILTPGDLTAKA